MTIEKAPDLRSTRRLNAAVMILQDQYLEAGLELEFRRLWKNPWVLLPPENPNPCGEVWLEAPELGDWQFVVREGGEIRDVGRSESLVALVRSTFKGRPR